MTAIKSLPKPFIQLQFPAIRVAAALTVTYLIWGSTYLGAAIVLESYGPFMLTAIRLAVSIVILFLALRASKARFPSLRLMLNAAVTGALMFAGAGMVALGQDVGVTSGLASLAVGAVPIWATLIAFFFGQRPSRVEVLGLAIGICGVAILNMESGMQAQPLGALILLIGPMLWAFGTVLSSRLSLPSGFMAVFFQMIGGLLSLTMISFMRGEQFPADPSALSTGALIYLAVIGTLVGFSAYMYLVRTVRPALATSYAYVNPVIAVILGAWILAEPVTGTGILAMLVIITGVVLVMIGKSR
ncbi:MAG: drug/metabolite exporter YedA [Chloroflexi bacterium]|nr:drug/metabolite exporter YedA [Chloroflexota bacterium]